MCRHVARADWSTERQGVVRISMHAGSYEFSHADAWQMRVRVPRGFTDLVAGAGLQTLPDAVFFVNFPRHSVPDTCPISAIFQKTDYFLFSLHFRISFYTTWINVFPSPDL